MSNDAVEAAWTELTAPQNETVTSKWYFKKGFEAATKAALGSRVVLPERKPDLNTGWPEDNYNSGFNECIDELLKLNPHLKERE